MFDLLLLTCKKRRFNQLIRDPNWFSIQPGNNYHQPEPVASRPALSPIKHLNKDHNCYYHDYSNITV